MKTIKNLSVLKTDAYKIGHVHLYPKNLTKIYSTLIPRENSFYPWSDEMVVFGYQMFVKKMVQDFSDNFFNQPLEDVLYTYERTIKSILGEENASSEHIKELHEYGRLPILIKALPEGTLAPMKVPVLTIENTDPRFPWLPNFLETMLLAETFVTSTVATAAHDFRKIAEKYADKSADDKGYIDFQFHDFSERGQHGNEASVLSGLAHLTSFKGSDVLQAATAAEEFYGANLDIPASASASVLASEHSVMEAYGKDQYKTYETLMDQNPNGILSVVSDTYDYWEVINDVLPALKDKVMSRNGKLVLRPDSGDMKENIVGTLKSLWETFGGTVNSKGYKVLDSHVGLIYGEGITLDNVEDIFDVMLENGFSAENIVLGVGAYVYSVLVSRDSFAQAIKAQVAVFSDGTENLIYKDPKTDTKHLKRSLKGAVAVVERNGKYEAIDNLTLEEAEQVEGNQLQTIFNDGKFENAQTLDEIRKRLGIK